VLFVFFFFQAEDGIRDRNVTGVQTCALPIWWFGHGHGVGLEGGSPTVDVGDEPAGPGGALVLAGPLVRPPARDESILRGAEIVLEFRPLLLLAGVRLFPALPFSPASGAVSGVAP